MPTYRGIEYSIVKGPDPDGYGSRQFWYGGLSISGKPITTGKNNTKREAVEDIEREIDIHLDYHGDHDLWVMVESLIREAERHTHKGALRRDRIPPTTTQLRSIVEKVCDVAKNIINTRYAQSDRAALAEKLRNMTVDRGCTPEEAATARDKFDQLNRIVR